MSGTTVKLLQAAAEIAGGRRELAAQLGIGETLLEKMMADLVELPDPLLLRAVDIILANRSVQVAPRIRPEIPIAREPLAGPAGGD